MSTRQRQDNDTGAKFWGADDVRRQFLDYFTERGHTVVPSSSLIPRDDPTLLFTNAGMNQFKEVFLGQEQRPYSRAASSQKCMRVSGKHNDLENVGPSTYHHTFFEMLGNFSFGDYFKADAIEMAWELLTVFFGLPEERLWASVYEEDDEAYDLWRARVGISESRLVRLGKKENFWAMGETGPCGPCSELHYDYGEAEGCGRHECGPDCDCGRFVELWNLVFMQFNSDAEGTLTPLPSPNIDTGAGLERLAAVLQGKRSNYDTDLFMPMIDAAAELSGRVFGESADTDVALRVIADHARATAFLLADGVSPANEGRGYVLRRLIRRAVRFGMNIGLEGPFLNEVAGVVVDRMSPAYPALEQGCELIHRVTLAEEERFFQTLAAGTQMFERLATEVKRGGGDSIPGEEAFRLYDTYGLPLELTREFAEDHGLAVDEADFEQAMQQQRERARGSWKGGSAAVADSVLDEIRARAGESGSIFLGYDRLAVEDAVVRALMRDGEVVDSLPAGDSGAMVVDRTPFYAESGGQIGDQGELRTSGGVAHILDTQRLPGGWILHLLQIVEGELCQGDVVELRVDEQRRNRTIRNHTATHLLHAALREQLGEHVKQAGSLVAPDRLRFDFAHYGPVSEEQIEALERQVNEAIRRDLPTQIEEMDQAEALKRGALAFFGEKYGDEVRVVSVPGVSMELCGGTHVRATGQIGAFFVTHEESVAAGTRRIEAVTGRDAIEQSQHRRGVLQKVMSELRTGEEEVPSQLESLIERLKSAEREVERLRVKLASEQASESLESLGVEVQGINVVAREVEDLDASGLRNLVDELKVKLGSGVVVLGMRRGGKAQLVVGVTADLADRVSASEVVGTLAAVVGGGGGGHKELAQAGGPDGDRLDEALQKAPEAVAEQLG